MVASLNAPSNSFSFGTQMWCSETLLSTTCAGTPPLPHSVHCTHSRLLAEGYGTQSEERRGKR